MKTSRSLHSISSKNTPPDSIYLFLLAVCLIGVMTLAQIVSVTGLILLDITIASTIQQMHGSMLDEVMVVISSFGYPVPAIILMTAAAALTATVSMRLTGVMVVGTALADAGSVLLKWLVARPRPTDDIVTVLEVLRDTSFPSSHVVHYTVFFGFMYFCLQWIPGVTRPMRRVLSAVCIGLVMLISVSRVYLGVHWPSDVLAGYFFGGGVLLSQLYWVSRRLPHLVIAE